MKKEELEVYLIIGVVFLAIFLFLKPNITGYVVYSPNYYNWTFDDSGNYVFDSNLIDISGGSAKLKSIPDDFVSYLIHEYRFEDNSNITEDSAGNADGIVSDAFGVEGKIGNGLDFDEGYVDLGNFDISGDEMTISAWFKADDFDVEDGRIISKATSQSSQDHYWMLSTVKENGKYRLRFRLKTNGDTKTLVADSDSQFYAGEWVFATAVYDGEYMILYKNGEEVGDKSNSGDISTNGGVYVWVGDNPGPNRKQFDGIIDEINIFNRALSAEEVLKLYNMQSSGSREYVHYPENGSLETESFSLPSVNRIGLFSKNEELNGQEIKYYYNDSEWIEISENGSLPELNEVKLKAEFIGDRVDTPVLYNMVLNYEYCEENWECSEFNICYENGTRARNCIDLNECGTVENKPEEIEICDYFPGYYDVNESNVVSFEKNNLTVLNKSDVVIDIIVNESVVGSNLEIKEVENLTELSGKVKIKGIDINLANVNDYLEEGLIKIYYDESYLTENNIDEDSLKIHYYNNESWEELDSSVNTGENYVYAYVKHFSVYGLFGDSITGSSPSGGSSGSGGKSTFIRGNTVEEPEDVVENIVEEVIEEIPVVENEITIEESKENNFESFTGLVVYNAKQAKVSVPIGIGLVAIMLIFFVKVGKFKRKIKV